MKESDEKKLADEHRRCLDDKTFDHRNDSLMR